MRRLALDLWELWGLYGAKPIGPDEMARLWPGVERASRMRRWERWKVAARDLGAPVERLAGSWEDGESGLVRVRLSPLSRAWGAHVLDCYESKRTRAERLADERLEAERERRRLERSA